MTVERLDLYTYLEPFAPLLGGAEAFSAYPQETLLRMVTHPGRRHIVYRDYILLQLLHVRGGYGVYNKNLSLQHAVAMSLDGRHQALYAGARVADVVIPQFTFGLDLRDALWVNTQCGAGNYFYLSYETLHPGDVFERQTDFVLVSPLSILDVVPLK